MGIMPPIRIEEIFFDHYRILNTIPDSQIEAKHYLDQAHAILQYKSNSLQNEEYRRIFYRRVPISRAIISATDIRLDYAQSSAL